LSCDTPQACSRAAFDISNKEILLLEVLPHFDRLEVYKFSLRPPPFPETMIHTVLPIREKITSCNLSIEPVSSAQMYMNTPKQVSESSNVVAGEGGNREIRKRNYIDIERGLA
jgi:hypothetical protein